MSTEESSKRFKPDAESTTESMESGPSPVIISEALAKFLGNGGREMLQAEATNRVWEYIKVNHLEVGCWCTSLFYFFHLNLFIYII